MKLFNLCLLLSGLTLSTLVMAETLRLGDADMKRLGIQFTRVRLADHLSGVQVPATVINSPESRSRVTALYAGIIEQWLIAPGDRVASGTVLATLASPQVMDVQQRWLASKNQFEQAAFDLEKDEQLYADGVISEQRLKQASRVFQQAKFHLGAMSETLTQAGFTDESRDKLISGIIKPGVYFLTAPVEGKLTQRHFDVGDYVEASAQVATVQGSESLWLRAQVPARLATTLRVGQELSLSDSKSLLILKQKDLQVSRSTQMVGILAEFSQPAAFLSGQIVSLRLPPAEKGVLVPASAVVHNGDNTSVFVRTQAGVELRTMSLQPAGTSYLAQENIDTGEFVVVQGASVLKGMILGLGGDE